MAQARTSLMIKEYYIPATTPAIQTLRSVSGYGLLTDSTGNPCLPRATTARMVNLLLKRLMDIVVSALAIVVFSPVLLLLVLAVKITTPGAVIFAQRREGLGGTCFAILKFRTMYLEHQDVSGSKLTEKDDPRVTPVGGWLRRTSLDELPQLFNVLIGDMSIVGPRPHVPGVTAGGTTYRALVPYYDMRHTMLPGITGLAQANGYRGSTEDAALACGRIDHDIAYIQHFTLWMDIVIILKTLKSEFLRGSGF
jgi:lipopolysaccharide/colanic/teichoic acid biosynthesis glycosyltransferase